MKMRVDFVTNSSSSSFIVAIKKDILDNIDSPMLKFLLNDFIQMVKDDTSFKIETEQNVLEYLYEIYYNYEDDLQLLSNDDSRKEFEELINLIKNNFNIYFLRFVDNRGDLHSLLQNSPNDNNFFIRNVVND